MNKAIPQSTPEQTSGGRPPAQPVAPKPDSPQVDDSAVKSYASVDDVSDATRVPPSDSDSSSQKDVPARQAKPHMPTQRKAALNDRQPKLAKWPAWGEGVARRDWPRLRSKGRQPGQRRQKEVRCRVGRDSATVRPGMCNAASVASRAAGPTSRSRGEKLALALDRPWFRRSNLMFPFN